MRIAVLGGGPGGLHFAALALVGESGAGKSASAMSVVGLLPEFAEKRLKSMEVLFGDEAWHRERIAKIAGL